MYNGDDPIKQIRKIAHTGKLTLPIKKVAFVLYKYPLGISSMIINSIRLFARKGYSIDVYVNKEHYNKSPITFTDSGISLIISDDDRFSFIFKCHRFLSKIIGDYFLSIAKRLSFNSCLLLFFPGNYRFMKWLKPQTAWGSYSYIFPVECMSLICLSFIKERCKLIYCNMELLDWEKKDRIYGNNKLVLKNLEYKMIRSLSRIVAPSPRRSDIFSQINQYDRDNIFILPVAPIGKGVIRKGSFFRQMFDIPEKDLIVLYCGQFVSYFQCIEIIQSVANWPGNTALIMHTWNNIALKTQYFKEMMKAATGLPIYFSTRYIAYEDLANAISSADIGLAFYEAVDKNYEEILFSSNKIGEYLKAGLPIISSDNQSLKQFIDEHDIGMAITVNKLPQAIKDISNRLDIVRRNVLNCYNTTFRFEAHFDSFYNKLSNLIE